MGGLEAYDDLNFVLCSATREKYLLCTQKNLRVCPPAGLVSAARILVSEQGDYEVQVLFQTIEKGKLVSVDSFIHLCFKICQLGGYKFCPGLNCGVYNEKYGKVLHRVSKSVKILSDPFERVESPKCQTWHKLASNSSIFERDLSDVMCQPCKKMRSYLDQLVRTAVSVTPARKASRQDPSSTCPISSLYQQVKRKGSTI